MRDGKGRFVKGESGNPKGRPIKAPEADYLNAAAAAVSLDAWQEVAEKALAQAKKGDAAARKWLSDYLMGVPVQKREVTGADGGAIQFIEVAFTDDADSSNDPD